MTDAISALPPATQPIRHESDYEGPPETREMAFSELWQDKEKGMSFGDILDIVNPLQHIPVVSTIYRMVTGDEISMGARMAGGALFGGPLGLLSAGVVAGFEEASGGTVEQHVASLFGTEGDGGAAGATDLPTEAQLAAAAPAVNAGAAANASGQAAAMPVLTEAQLALLTGTAPAAGQTAGPAPAAEKAAAMDRAADADTMTADPAAEGVEPGRRESAVPAAAAKNERADAAETARARLAREIAAAQRAQAGLLIASLQADGAAASLTAPGSDRTGPARPAAGEKAAEAAPAQAIPFRGHPYMLPRGAPADLVANTMERAVQLYHHSLQQQTAPLPAPR